MLKQYPDLRRIIFLGGHRKSGTTMFLTLFDGHPDLAVYPVDLTVLYAYYPQYTNSTIDSAVRRERLKLILGDGLRQACEAAGVDPLPFFQHFWESVEGRDLAQIGNVLSGMVTGWSAISPNKQYTVLKETSIEIYAHELLALFPNAKFIHLLRDPRDNFAALKSGVKNYYSKLGEDENITLSSLIKRALIGMRLAKINAERFKGRYLVVKFEDIVGNPEHMMNEICEFIGIDHDECLLTPSILGRPTGGNSFDGSSMFEINRKNVGRWPSRISREEASAIEFHFSDIMTEFGYEPSSSLSERVTAAANFYKWENYHFHYTDRFSK